MKEASYNDTVIRQIQQTPITSLALLKQAMLAQRCWSESELSVPQLSQLDYYQAGFAERQLQKAIRLIAQVRQNQQKVLIYGDYDVDGQTATSIMWLGLCAYGLLATPFIPDRFKHGYGMSELALKEIFAREKPDLIITVDNGVSAKSALDFCQQNQVPVIITDHHQLSSAKIKTAALIHSTALSGAAVAWYLVYQLLLSDNNSQTIPIVSELLDLVCLGTIVDQIPQKGICRQLCRLGLLQLRQEKRCGLKALAARANCDLSRASGKDLGFILGPRINAVGRLTGGLDALRLLCSQNYRYTTKLASVLNSINCRRQELTEQMYIQALAQIEQKKLPALLLVASENFHEGIIGLLASKLSEQFARPAIAISLGDKIAKASCRSVGKFNITNYLSEFSTQLLGFGGHCLAAGFSCKKQLLAQLSHDLVVGAQNHLSEILATEQQTFLPTELKVITSPQFIDLLDEFEPTGMGNEALGVVTTGVVKAVNLLGQQQNHLKIILAASGVQLEILFWQINRHNLSPPQIGKTITVEGYLEINYFRQTKKVQMIGKHWSDEKIT